MSLLANEPMGLVDRTPNSTAPQAAFAYEALPYRVVFGEGTLARAADEADRLGIKQALVLTTPQQHADGSKLGRALGHRLAAEFLEAVMHTPALADIGMPEDGIDLAAELATRNAYANPRSLDRAALRELLARAWRGEAPLS